MLQSDWVIHHILFCSTFISLNFLHQCYGVMKPTTNPTLLEPQISFVIELGSVANSQRRKQHDCVIVTLSNVQNTIYQQIVEIVTHRGLFVFVNPDCLCHARHINN